MRSWKPGCEPAQRKAQPTTAMQQPKRDTDPSPATAVNEAACPFFSVVTPVLDGGEVFGLCLAALRASSFDDYELIVVDDGSTDDSAERARALGARVLQTTGRRGPGAARNLGARAARGRYLLFLDADCEVHPDTLERAAAVLRADPELDALFGSYDDDPAAPGLVSQFKNLFHHFVHQLHEGPAVTFWAGCGAFRRLSFLRLGGFDEQRYSRPSIEDIELGYRLTAAGGRIRLSPTIQVRHHKRWTLLGLLRTDILDRGIPWTRLLFERGHRSRELNHQLGGRLSALLAPLMLASLATAPLEPRALWLAAASFAALLILNRRLCSFLLARRGLLFLLRSLPLLVLYHAYCALSFGIGVLRYSLAASPEPREA